jgi:hypothetical protein
MVANDRTWDRPELPIRNPLDPAPVERALWMDLDQWATMGTPPPDSAIPRLWDGTLAPPLPQSAVGFPRPLGVNRAIRCRQDTLKDTPQDPQDYGGTAWRAPCRLSRATAPIAGGSARIRLSANWTPQMQMDLNRIDRLDILCRSADPQGNANARGAANLPRHWRPGVHLYRRGRRPSPGQLDR